MTNVLRGIRIVGSGSFLPENKLTNHDLAKKVDTNDEWITSRTGIKERRIACKEQACSDLCVEATKKILQDAQYKAKELDLIIVATMTPDKPFPNTASILQKKIGATNAACFSMEVACSGFLYALEVGCAMLNSNLYKNVLIVGGEKLSSMINWKDRSTCILFGDGSGGVLLEKINSDKPFYISSKLCSDGRYEDILHTPLGGSATELSLENINSDDRFLQMEGNQVYKNAIISMGNACVECLEKADLDISDIDYFVPHQANIRIINALQKRLEFDKDKIFINIDKYGNTSAASIPIALDELRKLYDIHSGQRIMFTAFGGGLTWGASIIQIW